MAGCCGDGGPCVVYAWPPGQVSLLRRPGIGPHGLLQCQPGFRRVDPAGDLSIGEQAGLGVDCRIAGISSTLSRIAKNGRLGPVHLFRMRSEVFRSLAQPMPRRRISCDWVLASPCRGIMLEEDPGVQVCTPTFRELR